MEPTIDARAAKAMVKVMVTVELAVAIKAAIETKAAEPADSMVTIESAMVAELTFKSSAKRTMTVQRDGLQCGVTGTKVPARLCIGWCGEQIRCCLRRAGEHDGVCRCEPGH